MLPRSRNFPVGFTRLMGSGKAYSGRSGTFCRWRNICFAWGKGNSMYPVADAEVHQSFVIEAANTLMRQLGPAAVSYCDRALALGANPGHSGLLLALRAAMLKADAANGARVVTQCIH
jgi:hypothetical protein